MFRRERDAAWAESSAIIVLQWALATERVLHGEDWRQAINRGLPGENSCLNFVIVLREVAPQIQAAADADQRRESIVRKIFAVLDAIWRIRKMLAVFRVRGKHRCGHAAQRRKPIRVTEAQTLRADPQRLLIFGYVLQQRQPHTIVAVHPIGTRLDGSAGLLSFACCTAALICSLFRRSASPLLLSLRKATYAQDHGPKQTKTEPQSCPPMNHAKSSLITRRNERRAGDRRGDLRSQEDALPLTATSNRLFRNNHCVSS